MAEKLKDYSVAIVFLILPFAFLSPGLIWKSQLLFFLICPVFIVALNLKNVWVKTFLLYAALWQIVIFLAGFNNPMHSPGPGLSILLGLMAGAIIYKFVSDGDLPDETWFSIIRIAVIIQILIAIPQLFGVNPFMKFLSLFTSIIEKQPGHLVGTLGNRNYLSAFIAMSVPFFIGWRTFEVRGITINPALVFVFIFLFFCFSPATLAAFLGLIFIYSYRLPLKRKVMFLLGGVTFCAGYVYFYVFGAGTYFTYGQGTHAWEFHALPGQLRELWTTGEIFIDPRKSDMGRFGMILAGFSKLIKSWSLMILGYGPAASWGRPYPIHCEYMSTWFQYGLIGLGLMFGYIVTTFRFLSRGGHLILMGAFLIICIDMIGNFSLEVASTGFMIIIIAGLIERKRLNQGGLT
jgi:hypothetical protein